jgi:hypothetical protein
MSCSAGERPARDARTTSSLPGRAEAESRRLRGLVAAGRPIASVQIPTI